MVLFNNYKPIKCADLEITDYTYSTNTMFVIWSQMSNE